MHEQIESGAPAWMEIDLARYRANWVAIRQAAPQGVSITAVVKDDAYGHGAVQLAPAALANGADMLAVVTLAEALELRAGGISAPILILGERAPQEYAACLEQRLTPCLGSAQALADASAAARRSRKVFPVHLKIDTGMSRYGFRWSVLGDLLLALQQAPELKIEGVMSHFAMSDEADKTFAHLQLSRFNQAVASLRAAGIAPQWLHICNSGGLLNLPEAHFNRVRSGILPLGVFPSKASRRIDGIKPVMSVKARLAATRELEPGDHVGYGMRFTAPTKIRIGVIPAGYGAGYPRVRNQGEVLIRGRRAPIIGGVSMDAIMVDLSKIPDAAPGDTVTLLGEDGAEEITVHDLAALRNTVSYDIMVAWSSRLPRLYLDG